MREAEIARSTGTTGDIIVSSTDRCNDNWTRRERRPRRSIKRFDWTKFDKLNPDFLFTDNLFIQIVQRSDGGAMCVEYGKQSVNKSNATLAPNAVIPRTYLWKLQLQFLSEESSHSPVSSVKDVRGILSYSATEVQLCHNVQSAVFWFVQTVRYGRS